VQSLNRLVTILEAVAAKGPAVSAAQVAESVGLSLSTVSRLMIQLADVGLLHRSARDRRYTLGPRLYALARAADSQIDVTAIARPLLEQLRDATGETASMHVARGRQRVCILEVPSHHAVRRVVRVGMAEPVFGSATGAVLLAARLPHEQAEELDALDVDPAERRRFEALVAHAAETGWALAADAWVPGLTGLSAAVRDGSTTFAAISASGPSSRFTAEIAESHVDTMLRTAEQISAQIGRVE
jgi:DNA-binding IclR family transcriptional regulator